MTQEQREHIAETIGMMEIAGSMLKMQQFETVGMTLYSQCEILQEMLDLDREVAGRCAE